MRNTGKFPLLLLTLFFASACETMDFSEDEGDDTHTESTNKPNGTGKGTQELPLTVEDILYNRLPVDASSCWVIGYVVGATYQSMNNAEFRMSTSYTTNILLATDSTCTSAEYCIPVELKGTQMQKAFALPHNPSGFRQCAMFNGMPGKYFKKQGLRNAAKGTWLYGFDISNITPEDWQTDSIP